MVTDGAPSGSDAAPHSNSPTRSAAETFTRMIVETMGEGGGKPTFEWNEGLRAETPPLTPGRALMTPKPQCGNHFPSFGFEIDALVGHNAKRVGRPPLIKWAARPHSRSRYNMEVLTLAFDSETS